MRENGEVYCTHPYSEYIPDGATRLIIGSMPPLRFCKGDENKLFFSDVDFYYGSKDNFFWKLLSEATGVTLHYENTADAVLERKRLLYKLGAGITDIVKSCVRKNGLSDDASLNITERKDIGSLLLKYPHIDTLIYTSMFVKSEVGKELKSTHRFEDKKHRFGSITVNGRIYKAIVLYSPSPNALRGVKREVRLAQYMAVFGGIDTEK